MKCGTGLKITIGLLNKTEDGEKKKNGAKFTDVNKPLHVFGFLVNPRLSFYSDKCHERLFLFFCCSLSFLIHNRIYFFYNFSLPINYGSLTFIVLFPSFLSIFSSFLSLNSTVGLTKDSENKVNWNKLVLHHHQHNDHYCI